MTPFVASPYDVVESFGMLDHRDDEGQVELDVDGERVSIDVSGPSGCGRCGWRGIPTFINRRRQDTCPGCQVPETHECVGEQRVAAPEDVLGRGPWARLNLGDLYRPRMAPVIQLPVRKVGRNEPCPCDSGRKYKKCCGAAA